MPKGIPKNGINKGWLKKGNIPWSKGLHIWKNKPHPKGMLGKKQTKTHKDKISSSMIGKSKTLDARKNMSEAHKGEKNYNWKGGTEKINKVIRKSLEYRLWRTAVFERDNYTCIWCGFKGYVEADHIKPFALFPELRFAIDNGRTLCKDCHKTTETYGNKPIYKLT